MGLRYRLTRSVVKSIIRPQMTGAEDLDTHAAIYVLSHRSLGDLLATDIVCEQYGLASPLSAIDLSASELGDDGAREARRFFFLNRASGGLFRRNTMKTYSERLLRLRTHALENPQLNVRLVPVSVFWGRAPNKEKSWFRMLFSESWEMTSSLKRVLGLVVNRKRILVHYGHPILLSELVNSVDNENLAIRRIARVMRVALRNQRVATLGPDFSHRRTLVQQIASSRRVTEVIRSTAETEKQAKKLHKQAHKHALEIASNLSYTPIRVMERILTWFWHKIYSGVEVHHIDRLQRYAETHTVVLTPSHRSHIDYLLLSYTLFNHGLMIPHIAAGDNLNLPIIGGVLRRCGAFFMRRSFRDDPLYYAVFSEYLYQVFRRGHSVEYFVEGGRSRTGRLLPAKTGLLQMTIEHHERGVPRPIVFVPVYFGYEKLIEATSYLNELRGADKKKESIRDLFNSAKLLKRNFGKVSVNFGEPLALAEFLEATPTDHRGQASALGAELLVRINAAADINPINLVAMIMLSMPRLAMDEAVLTEQIRCYLDLLSSSGHRLPDHSPADIVRAAEHLDLLGRESYPDGDIMTLTSQTAVLGTWYRNNVVHTLVVPALIGAMMTGRRRPVQASAIVQMVHLIYPYLQNELYSNTEPQPERWLGRMQDIALIGQTDEMLHAPPVHSDEYYRLRNLSLMVLPTLERFYIAIGLLTLLTEPPVRTRLASLCQSIAERMSRLYGLNAPEFFDRRLFDQFIDLLIERGAVTVQDDETLVPSAIVADVVRHADRAISPEFRQAVYRAVIAGTHSGDAQPADGHDDSTANNPDADKSAVSNSSAS